MAQTLYDDRFYDDQGQASLASARVVVPMVVNWLHAKSMLDVGCGLGPWVRAALDLGLEAHGVDGYYVKPDMLLIPTDNFYTWNLLSPLDMGHTYDLVMSLEVAEHIHPDCADDFVNSLVNHGDAVLFSAAIPGQHGTGHVNMQWPEYWIRKFALRDYECFDIVRRCIWDDERIEGWYRQNSYLFALRDTESWMRLTERRRIISRCYPNPTRVIHPDVWQRYGDTPSIRQIAKWVVPSVKRAVQRRIH